MTWYHWFTSVALVVCLAGFAFHALRLIRLGMQTDFSRPAGRAGRGVAYAFTLAMDPRKKESARLHLPTYAAGLIYHAGTFVAFLVFILLFFFDRRPADPWNPVAIAILSLSTASGAAILVKRLALGTLRALSTPDDYISNILLTGFQLLTIGMLLHGSVVPLYVLWTGLLLLYMPVGKLRHAVYFIMARIQAGIFYGRRGVWPAARQ